MKTKSGMIHRIQKNTVLEYEYRWKTFNEMSKKKEWERVGEGGEKNTKQ